jgi:hypothetical protein
MRILDFAEISMSQFVRFAEKHSHSDGYRRIGQQSRRDFSSNAVALRVTLCSLLIYEYFLNK